MSARVLNNHVPKGRKVKRNCEAEWPRNVAKRQRLSGAEYVSKRTGKTVCAKVFHKVESCCKSGCFNHFKDGNIQSELYHAFYSCDSKEAQDVILSGCMRMRHAVVKKPEVVRKTNRDFLWDYTLKHNGLEIKVCREFLLKLYNLSTKRLRVVQRKLRAGKSFSEMRGKKGNPKKIDDSVWELALEHLFTIPHRPPHYTAARSNRLYFKNPELNVTQIYNQFALYYQMKTREKLKMSSKTYFKFFRQTNFTFTVPKTDTCDFCRECEVKLEKNPNDPCKAAFETHKQKAKEHDKLKADIIKKAKLGDDSPLVLEFDYAQNFPLPKLSVSKQFYKRSLWLYACNFHIHNDDSSIIYTFVESQTKKGTNSIASFLFHTIKSKMLEFPNTKKIILLSDACGGQNKNYNLMKFCSWTARVLQVEIEHVFPVRGHSFGQCDRNFGVIRNKVKSLEIVELPKVYEDLIRNCREHPSPFLVYEQAPIYEWSDLERFYANKPFLDQYPTFSIMRNCFLKYNVDGTVCASHSYESRESRPYQFWNGESGDVFLTLADRIPLKAAKIKDVRDLYRYMSPDSLNFYEQIFAAAPPVISNKKKTVSKKASASTSVNPQPQPSVSSYDDLTDDEDIPEEYYEN